MVTTQMATSTTNVPRARPQDAVPRPSTRRTEHRQVVYRVLPGSEGRARRLASIAGACRFVWNELLDQQEQLHTMARMCGGRTPSPTFFTMAKAFTDLRRVTPWLQDMAFTAVRYTLKHQADAWRRFFDGTAGRPRFKRRGRDSVTIPQDVRIEDNRLWFPRLGWLALRRRGGNPYPEGRPVKAVLKRAGGRWMATVCYEVEAPARADDGTVTGIDRNVRQVASCDGKAVRFHHGPDTARLEARTRRYQRRMARQQRGSNRRERTRRRLARTTRRLATVRHNWHHQVSRRLATGTVVLENLSTRSMTKSAKGTAEEPGTNVRAKTGPQPSDSRNGMGSARADARVQDAPSCQSVGQGHQPHLPRVRAHRPRVAAKPSDIPVRGLRPRGPRGRKCGPQHTASGTGAAARRGAFGKADSPDP